MKQLRSTENCFNTLQLFFQLQKLSFNKSQCRGSLLTCSLLVLLLFSISLPPAIYCGLVKVAGLFLLTMLPADAAAGSLLCCARLLSCMSEQHVTCLQVQKQQCRQNTLHTLIMRREVMNSQLNCISYVRHHH